MTRRVLRSRSQLATGPGTWNFPVLPNTRRRNKSTPPHSTFVLWRSTAIYAPSPDADLIVWVLLSPTSRFARRPLGWLARIPYDFWRSVHRQTGVFVILAMMHGFLDFPPELQRSPLLNITYLLICGVGVAAFLYRELLMSYFLPRTEYGVGAVEWPDARTLLVNLEPRGEPLAFARQFV